MYLNKQWCVLSKYMNHLRRDSSLIHRAGQIFALDSVVVKTKKIKLFSSHRGFLTNAMYHYRDNQIKLTHYDDTEKGAHDARIVRAKEKSKLRYGGPSQRQASGTNQRIKSFASGPSLSRRTDPPSCQHFTNALYILLQIDLTNYNYEKEI